MNENQKNIETCLPEDILAEVANVPTDAQFRSLVEESFDPLQQQAVEQAGSDAYEQVVESHQPYTFTSTIVQMKSNLILLLRRLWRFPFGTGTLRSLSDMWQHYIDRLSGNAEYGIPSRLSDLTALPSAPLLLADRKISGIGDDVDGMSIPNLLCSAAGITEITDDNEPWVYNRNFPWNLFPDAKKATFNCISAASKTIFAGSNLEEAYAPYLDHIEYVSLLKGTKVKHFVNNVIREMIGGSSATYAAGCSIEDNSELETIEMQGLKKVTSGCYAPIRNCAKLEEVDWRSVEYIAQGDRAFIVNCPKVWKIVLGKLTFMNDGYASTSDKFAGDDLIHFEIGQDTAISLPFRRLEPTNALDASRTDLIEEGSTAEDNLQQFLQNFHDYIAERLATFPEGTTDKTLTLSAAVYSAIWDNNGDPLPTTICQEIDRIIVDTKHWRLNNPR